DTHPQYGSYVTMCDFSKPLPPVPNFIGGSLPRKDQGDHEYYCMTMLTLFRPWRTGSELRTSNNELWAVSFHNYSFKHRHNIIMDNLNLKYECRDAKDD
ncbi:hypothetical protein BJ165DRAFT_1325457, partial [Panaeolus papilionaceus]